MNKPSFSYTANTGRTSESLPLETGHICFAPPVDYSSSMLSGESPSNEFLAAEGVIEDQESPDSRGNDLLSGLSTRGVEAMSHILPTLLCGEESAVHVFHREVDRLDAIRREAANRSLLAQIAAEEAEHARLLGLLHNCLPISDDFVALRRRTRYFFIRLASRDPATHFARIAGLDSGVCITLSSMLHPSAALAKAPKVYQIWNRIWRDEARHVRISRQHVIDLGFERAKLIEEGREVRKKFADTLVLPLSDDFENVGVDPDKLFRGIIGSESI